MEQEKNEIVSKSILLVENESDSLSVEKEILEKEGFTVLTAVSIEKTSEIIDSTPVINLVLMDVNFCSEINIHKNYSIPILFMYSAGDREELEKIGDIENYGFYLKGSGAKILLNTISLALHLFDSQHWVKDLRESEVKFKSLFYSAGDGAFILQDGKVIDCNDRATSLLGTTREQIIGLHPWEFAPSHQPDGTPTKDKALEWINAVLDGTPQQFEFQHAKLNGELMDVEMTLNIIDTEKKIVLGIIRDITIKKSYEIKLKEREERLKEAQKIAHLGHWVLDIKNDELTWSDEVYRIFGLKPQQFDSTYEAFLENIHPEDRELVNNAYLESLEKRMPYDIIHRLLLHDGSIKYINERCETFYDAEGSALRSVGTIQDITEQKEAEQEIQIKNIELTKSIKEKETLIRELFHRTRNTILLINAMLSLQGNRYSLDENVQELINITEQRIQAISLVHQMLYSAQNLSCISAKDYLYELSNLIFQGFPGMSERILLDLKIENHSFLIDTAVPVGIIINELMTNSLNHGFPGDTKGKISISATWQKSGNTILQFSDNGRGVPEDFDFRNQNTLGLKLIYNIGEQQLQGKVTMESKDGIECTIELPHTQYTERV